MPQTPRIAQPAELREKPTGAYWLKQLRNLGLILLVVYGTLILLVHSPLYEAVVLRPSPANENYEKARQVLQFQEYFIPCHDGHQLHAWLFNPGGSRTLVIVHHGSAGKTTNYQGPKKLILISQAGHNDMPAGSREYRAELCQFLKNCSNHN